MFKTYDMTLFGRKLKEIRKLSDYTQEEIYNLTGVHTDTIRRLEKGISIPNFETIEKLSIVYNTDLLLIMSSTIRNFYLEKIYDEIDIILLDLNEVDNHKCLFEINKKIKEFIALSKGIHFIVVEQLMQIRQFIKLLEEYINRSKLNFSELIEKYENCYKITNNKVLNHVQLRIIMIISVLKFEQNLFKESNQILFKIKGTLENRLLLSLSEKKIYIKCIGNISYNFHELSDHENALKYANLGISFCKENEILYILYMLYARKSVAQYKLEIADYLDSAKNSITLLDIMGLKERKNQYIKGFKEEYSFNL